MHSIVKKLAKFYSMSTHEQHIVLIAVLLLPGFWLGLRVLGFNRFQRRLTRAAASGKPPLSHDEMTALGTLVNSAAFHAPGPANCLSRSLFLQWLLRRRGVESELRIGVQLRRGRLDAHAWLEVGGRPVNDALGVAERYAAFNQPLSAGLFSSP